MEILCSGSVDAWKRRDCKEESSGAFWMDRYGLERRLRSGRRADSAAIFANKLLQK